MKKHISLSPAGDLSVIWQGDCRDVLALLPSDSVHCVVTSPPYWNLRDYGVDGQLGLEATLMEYVENLVAVFHEVRRVLRPDGTCWLNIGDAYAAGGNGGGGSFMKMRAEGAWNPRLKKTGFRPPPGLKHKDLIGLPWRVAFALQADGWWLRAENIWNKPNPMPESVRDRPTKAHEQVFLLTKSKHYFWDKVASREPRVSDDVSQVRGSPGECGRMHSGRRLKVPSGWDTGKGAHGNFHREGRAIASEYRATSQAWGRNMRDVWTIAPKPFKGAHFATFPPKLVERCLKAGCPVGGVVLDPFGGSGTTAAVAVQLGCHAISIELNPKYIEMAQRRIAGEQERERERERKERAQRRSSEIRLQCPLAST